MTALPNQHGLYAMVVDPRGYTPQYDQALAQGLANAGCRVLLATAEHSELDWNFTGSFSRWNRFCEHTRDFPTDGSCSFRQRTLQALDYCLSMHKFLRLVQRENPDVIHFQWLPLPIMDQAYLSWLRRRAKLILTLHNTTLFHGEVSRSRALGLASALKQFDAVIVHTNFSKERVLERSWIDESRLHVIPHGAFEHYRKLARIDGQSSSAKRLLFFGNLQPYKGVDTLLQAFSKLSAEAAASTRLMIAGRPIMDPRPLFELARQLGIEDRVDWDLRPIPEEEVAHLFRDSTAVVLPYREIDQSGVLMTAIAFGKPVIATKVGGIPETVQDGIHGYLVPAGDADELARAASALLSSGEQLQKMEQAMRDLSTGSFSWKTIAASTMNLYRKLLGHAESVPMLSRPHEVQSALG